MLLSALLVALAAPGPVSFQGDGDSRLPAEDPYTHGEREALDGAGYRNLGPFRWGDAHTTVDVDEVLGFSLLWVETEHFRIGSSLPEYTVPGDRDEKRRIRDELGLLAKRLPDVPRKPRKLDPWLRLHLVAQRAEGLFEEFAERMGAKGNPDLGPNLGQREKYLLLVTEEPSTLGRYTSHFLARSAPAPVRHYFPETGCLLFAASLEHLGEQNSDSALQCLIAYGLTSNLVDGHRAFTHATPLWWREGLAHWFSRRIDPRWSVYSKPRAMTDDAWKWEQRVRGRVERGHIASSAEMLTWSTIDQVDYNEQLTLWSRVDYLLQLDGGGAEVFQWIVKGPLEPAAKEGIDPLVVLQKEALLKAWRLTPDELDRDWEAWVRKNYSKR